MKFYFILLILLLTSIPSFGEWVKTGLNINGDIDYIDIDRIKKIDDYIFYWALIDYPKPSEWGDMSVILHMKGDCKLNRVKYLSFIYAKEPMGEGKKELSATSKPEWKYLSSDSGARHQLESICKLLSEDK